MPEQAQAQERISIHAPRTGSDLAFFSPDPARAISIHAPRPGRVATPARRASREFTYFNPRSPHGERPGRLVSRVRWDAFQSTLPARGATRGRIFKLYPRKISIHAPRTGSDPILTRQRVTPPFQSTLPARGATTVAGFAAGKIAQISIHAPRTGSDRFKTGISSRYCNFNPRSPHGERPILSIR